MCLHRRDSVSFRPRASGGGGPPEGWWRGRGQRGDAQAVTLAPSLLREFSAAAMKRRVRGPLHRAARGPPPPLPRGRKEGAFSRRDVRASLIVRADFVARMEQSVIRERWFGCTAAPDFAEPVIGPATSGRTRWLHPGYEERKEKKKKEAERRQTRNPRAASSDAARAGRSALACRRSTAALTRGNISSQRLSFRPGFRGLGLRGCYPPSPVPVQGCTSHPGHNAGRLMPELPGSGVQIRPRAPHSAPPFGMPPQGVL
jgi:hypothetical protein